MERIYWIGTGLTKCIRITCKTQRLGRHDPEWKPVDEVRYSAQDQLPSFQDAHAWLWTASTPHKEYEATKWGMKDLMNALCYTKGDKSILAYSRLDMFKSPAFRFWAGGAVDVWITDVARMGGTVFFAETMLKKPWVLRAKDAGTNADDSDKLDLGEYPTPEAVREYDENYGRKTTRRQR